MFGCKEMGGFFVLNGTVSGTEDSRSEDMGEEGGRRDTEEKGRWQHR